MAERMLSLQCEEQRDILEPQEMYRSRLWQKSLEEWRALNRAERKNYEFKARLENSNKTLMGDRLVQFAQELEADPEVCLDSPFGLMDNDFPLGQAVFQDCIEKFNSAPQTCSFIKHHATLWREQHGEILGVDEAQIPEDSRFDEPQVS